MYLPGSWYNEYEEYKKEEFRGNVGIYDSFTDEQFEVIKDYFRWRTKKRFKEIAVNTSLIAKPKKAEILSNIMGNATDWVYDGCIDTGYLGGGFCELGHQLRYAHYALSKSTGNYIVFGSTCASDFFGIEPEKLRQINKVQDEILEEVKLIAFILNTGKHKEYFKRFYGNLMDVINTLRNEINEAFGKDWNQQMANFLKVGLPWTASMINKYNYVYKYIYLKRLEDEKKKGWVSDIGITDEKLLKIANDIIDKTDIYMIKIIKNYLALNSKTINRDRAVGLIILCEKFNSALLKIKDLWGSDLIGFVNGGKQSVYYISTGGRERLATIGEVKAKVPQLICKEVIYVTERELRMLRLFGWGLYGYKNLYKESGCDNADSEIEMVFKSGNLMVSTLNLFNNKDELAKLVNKLRDYVKPIEYPENTECEIKSKVTIEEMIRYISENSKYEPKTKLVEIAIDIANKAIKFKNYDVSVKQANVLRSVYSMMNGGKEVISQPDVGMVKADINNDEIFKKIDILLKNKDHSALSNNSFVFVVIDTVKKYGRVSEKQRNIINLAYNDFIKSGAVPELMPKNYDESSLFIENDSNKDKNNIKKEVSEYFIDSKDNKNIDMDISGKSVNMPSITQISDALGGGVFNGSDEQD